jgi:hypothetical protein
MRFSARADDPEMSIAASALESMLVKRWIARFAEWERTRHLYSQEWQEAGEVSETFAFVTPDELDELTEEIRKLFCRYEDRIDDPARRPEGSRPVEMVAFAFPFDLADPSKRLRSSRAGLEAEEVPAEEDPPEEDPADDGASPEPGALTEEATPGEPAT